MQTNNKRLELLQALHELSNTLGRSPMKKDVRPIFMQLYREFGGLRPALKEAGIKSITEQRQEHLNAAIPLIIQMRHAGKTIPQIAKSLHFPKMYVGDILRGNGIRGSFPKGESIYTCPVLSGRDPYQPGMVIHGKKFSFSINANARNITANYYRVYPDQAGKTYPLIGFTEHGNFDVSAITWISDYDVPLTSYLPLLGNSNPKFVVVKIRDLKDDYNGPKLSK